MGRRRPYTAAGIKRVPCAKCGNSSSYQWQICAMDNMWHGVCAACDVALNRTVLEFFQPPGWQHAAQAYHARVQEQQV